MPLTPKQQGAFDELQEQLPTDFLPGITIEATTADDLESQSPWLKRLRRMSDELSENAYSYFNFEVRKGRVKAKKRRPRRIMSSEGFPQDITVTYAYPPPFSFRSVAKSRDVKFVVLHSFGHAWHATRRRGSFAGWLNSTAGKQGVVPYQLDGKTVYVARGSDAESLHHYSRFMAGLRTVLLPTSRAAAHFFIDRNGNLVVIGDCNDILYASNNLNSTSVGIELEEAFYVLEDPKEQKAIWKAGGDPVGTAGNVKYLTYSAKQLLTLSVVCKKLELAYPKIGQRNVSFVRRALTSSDPPGYTMHDFIKASHHLDVSPQFLTQETWDSFFKLVDSHSNITTDKLWKPVPKYADAQEIELRKEEEDDRTAEMNALSEILINPAKVVSLAKRRVLSTANKDRKLLTEEAGKRAVQESYKAKTTYAGITRKLQQAEGKIKKVPSGGLNQKNSRGNQVNSDDVW